MEDIGGERERKVGHNPLIQDLYLKDIVEKKVSFLVVKQLAFKISLLL